MPQTAILRTRIEPRRKAAAEAVLRRLGVTPTQAVNMLYAQIAQRKAIPFTLSLNNSGDILPPIEHVAQAWGKLDNDDFSHLAVK